MLFRSDILCAVLWARIFLSRLSGPQPKAFTRALFDLCDDRAVLHDPLQQTDARNYFRHRRRHLFGLVKLQKWQHLARFNFALHGRIFNGHLRPPRKRFVVLECLFNAKSQGCKDAKVIGEFFDDPNDVAQRPNALCVFATLR